jgi:WD40 repeat protein
MVGPPVDTDRRGGLGDVSISPDDRFVAIGFGDGTVEVRAAPSMKLLQRLRAGRALVNGARFSPDARLLVGSDDDGKAYVWSTKDWKPVIPTLSGQAGVLLQTSVTADDRMLAASSTDGTVALWDLATGRQIGTPLPGQPNRSVAASFTPDGRWLFAAYVNGIGYRWDMRLASWRAKACAVAGRDLSRAEWDQLGPARPYEPVCP